MRPSGNARSTSFSARVRGLRRLRRQARRLFLVRERAIEGVLERGQTLDRGAEIGEADVAVDKEVHRAVDVAERVGRLIETAEVDDFCEVERGDDHIGDDDGNLAVELVEGDQPGATWMMRRTVLTTSPNTLPARSISRSSPLRSAICSLYSRMRARSKRKFASTACCRK